MNALHRAAQLALECGRHTLAEFTQIPIDPGKFFLPELRVNGQ